MRRQSMKKPASGRKKSRFQRREMKCRFCRDKQTEIDYKDIAVLFRMATSQGKHFSRKRTGNCAKHQRATRRALKRARFIGLMPFCG